MSESVKIARTERERERENREMKSNLSIIFREGFVLCQCVTYSLKSFFFFFFFYWKDLISSAGEA